jgi:rhamnogalacturonyl hydrolase YesR
MYTKKMRAIVSGILFMLFCCGLSAQQKNIFRPDYIKSTMLKVADWQMNHSNKKKLNDWTNGAFYDGVFAAYRTTKSQILLDSMMAMGERMNWMAGRRYDHADDYAISQTYIELYRLKKDKKLIQCTIDSMQKMMTVPGNEVKNKGITWWWCDALFMAPPVMAQLAKTLKDPSCLVYSDTLYRQSYRLLYNTEEHLFARDASYLWDANGNGKKEANGKKMFWGRGNGWVIAGLVKYLQEMPKDYAGRDFYLTLYKEIANRLLLLQQADGLWRTSLLDPDAYPGGEGSGSGFNCYALAWGVNEKILDRKIFLPAIRKAWEGLNALVSDDGRVGWVQPIGADPRRNFSAESWEAYGAGAFLLAGSEIIKLKN